MRPRLSLCLLALVAAATPARAEEPPDGIRRMSWTALDTKDPTIIAAVVSVAKQAAPESAAEIDIIAQEATERVIVEMMPRPERTQPPEPASALSRIDIRPTPPRWRGAVEVGAARSTGNTRSVALYGSVDLSLKDIAWTHKINARADYQETRGASTAERFSVAYQPQLALDGTLYTYGLGQYEHDRFIGYRNRYTLGVGAGLTPISRPDLTLAVDAGPAFRHTEFYAQPTENGVAGRASLTMKWAVRPNLTIAHDTSFFYEESRTTARSTTALDTLLFGPLKARLSYNIEYEKDRQSQRSDTDTSARASLVYGF